MPVNADGKALPATVHGEAVRLQHHLLSASHLSMCFLALERGGRVTAADGQGNGGGPLDVAGLGLLPWLSCGTVSFIIILHWT